MKFRWGCKINLSIDTIINIILCFAILMAVWGLINRVSSIEKQNLVINNTGKCLFVANLVGLVDDKANPLQVLSLRDCADETP